VPDSALCVTHTYSRLEADLGRPREEAAQTAGVGRAPWPGPSNPGTTALSDPEESGLNWSPAHPSKPGARGRSCHGSDAVRKRQSGNSPDHRSRQLGSLTRGVHGHFGLQPNDCHDRLGVVRWSRRMDHESCVACDLDGSLFDARQLLAAIRALGPRWSTLLLKAGDDLRVHQLPKRGRRSSMQRTVETSRHSTFSVWTKR